MFKYKFFLVCIFLYSDWVQENTDQKKLRIWTLFTQSLPQKLGKVLIGIVYQFIALLKILLPMFWKFIAKLLQRFKQFLVYLLLHLSQFFFLDTFATFIVKLPLALFIIKFQVNIRCSRNIPLTSYYFPSALDIW